MEVAVLYVDARELKQHASDLVRMVRENNC
jgi:antitoxin (DNA-binding transcriptional repressor) of toxin-antitoxin stability system